MISSIVRHSLDFVFANRGINSLITEEIDHKNLEEARIQLNGKRPNAELETIKNAKGFNLVRRSWSPPSGTRTIGLVYICHGFTEHMGMYNGLGEFLSQAGLHCFGTDLIGHGLSDTIDGQKAFVPDFDNCVQDMKKHVLDEKAKFGSNLPIFAVAHSMGGLLTLRLTLDNPGLFKGIVLVGPLIHFGSSAVFKSLPMQSLWPWVDTCFQWIIKQIGSTLISRLDNFQIGVTHLDNITSDIYMRQLLERDHLRHFGGIYFDMLSQFSGTIARNLHDLDKMTTPFCILFGQNDPLCNVKGGWDMYFGCNMVNKADKQIIEFPHASHQLYLEISPIREKAMRDTLAFLLART